MIDKLYQLENGFCVKFNEELFDFYLNDMIIINNCTNVAYRKNALIAIKKENVITIFSTKTKLISEVPSPITLAKFTNFSEKVFAKVIINNTNYIIDYNCKITSSKINFN
jgi:hypothetical protein